LVFEVDAGTVRVSVMNGRGRIFDKELYFSKGQTRVVRIRDGK